MFDLARAGFRGSLRSIGGGIFCCEELGAIAMDEERESSGLSFWMAKEDPIDNIELTIADLDRWW